ncbi:uncharacterized protein LOC113494412 isoform X2 [Trichoplusia ni]|uniref:Uncharacterized protein LOC113494412 isoform X2 n=1 Tax=Trichoplusia ni TaxID=7111 RepID=A0A7E5VJR3_TRINI|nr:uncharacterized protein LOC113494412 isoform X2 [Trichoplusia ni]
MLLLLLLHLVIIHLLTARDAPPRTGKEVAHVVRNVEKCPAVGYFFRRDTAPNAIEPGPCYLCFCQEENNAVCWKRDNRRCNVESFHYHGVGKRDTRIRRSPGFADLFFRDATRDLFNKNEKTECKPFESSFSDDCPPADWCIGCTVCDCDANGRWDCHVLSFCPDKKTKKKSKRKGAIRKVVSKKSVKSTKAPDRTTKKPSMASSAGKRISKQTKAVNKSRPKNPVRSTNNKNQPQKRLVKKSVPILRANITPKPQKIRSPLRYRRKSATKANSSKEMIIKRNVATHKPIDIKASKVNLEMEIAQKVMKKVMANLRKTMDTEMLNITKMANKVAQNNFQAKNVKKTSPTAKQSKKVNKRQIKKPQKKPVRSRYQLKPSKDKNKNKNKQNKKSPQQAPKKPYKKPASKPTRRPTPNNYVRNKRDLMEGNLQALSVIGTGNVTAPLTTSTAAYSIVPVTGNILPPADTNCSTKLDETTPIPENNKYYSYVVHDPKLETNTSTTKTEVSTQVNVTETVLNLIGKGLDQNRNIKNKSESSNYDDKKSTALSEISPEANEIKYSKWSHLKILKEKKLNYVSEKHRGLVKLISPANKSVLEDYKNKVHGRDIERKFNSRKFNLVKLLNHSKYKPSSVLILEHNTNVTTPNKTAGDLQSILSKLLGEFYRNSTISHNNAKKARKFSVIKYLKKIFNKLFRRKKASERFSKHQIIETLCDNFGPCRVSVKDKAQLKAKLDELDSETSKILKTVKIIKGLLKLVDLPKSMDSSVSTQESMRNDIQKLNSILKGNYLKGDSDPMTSTQLTQIEYIKKNTQDFVQSVNKFAALLNDIITILTKHDVNKTAPSNRALRYNHSDNKISQDENPFQSLKHLFIRYNLVQNSFMKKMYEQLNNFESKVNENPKVSDVKDLNNTVEIENFSRNIIQNLRKLKRLAQTLSFSGRSKRDTMRDDDAIEYLLMLMEYLLKQNNPLDAAPVNDGIDLLIDAIKNAPDIKPIKKKVLEYTPAPYVDVTTNSFVPVTETDNPLSDDGSHSDNAEIEKNSGEDSGRRKLEDTEDNLRTKIQENKVLAEMVAEEDKDPDDKYQYNRKTVLEKGEEYTERPYYNRAGYENVALEADNAVETTTQPIDFEMSEKIYKDDGLDNLNLDRQINLETNNLEKQVIDQRVDEKKFEVYAGDIDEESILSGGVLTSVSVRPSTATTEYATQAKRSRTKMRHLNLESIDSESIDKKSKLEWIEENFGREREKEMETGDPDDFNITTPRSVTYRTLSTATSEKADLSVLTKEIVDDDKRRKANLNAEDIIFKKQMDLLNSLDYGTEKAEFDESESKDGNVDERYPSDTFPTYFR